MARYAAIDIGSNSIRMLAAEALPRKPLEPLASERRVVRLGESVFRNGAVSEEAMQLACEVLSGMAAQYRRQEPAGIRAVATSAVRDARNQNEFLDRASDAIGAPVEIVSGQEEARLIQAGVRNVWPQTHQRALIIDIGGGSAEIIHTRNDRLVQAFSKPLGAVRLTQLFLEHDPPQPRELCRLQEYIGERIAAAIRRVGKYSWDRAIGTSATAAAVVCAVNGIPRERRDQADRRGASTENIAALYEKLCAADLRGRRAVTGIGQRRAEIIVAGAAVLLRLLREFRISTLYYCTAGVREGIIADLADQGTGHALARLKKQQLRAVREMAQRYGGPIQHARKVAGIALALFDALKAVHKLPPVAGRVLEAAAWLHDIGHYVSDTRHHKHSYYLVSNAELPGFTDRERELIAHLCRYHRKAMPSSRHDGFQAMREVEKETVLRLIPLLRVADGLDRSLDQRLSLKECRVRDGEVLLELASDQDIGLELWALERAAQCFEQVYGRRLAAEKSK